MTSADSATAVPSTIASASIPQHQTSTSQLASTTSNKNNIQAQQPQSQQQPTKQQQQPQTNVQSRQGNTTICVPIVFGSIAFPLPKTEEYNTHRWTLYVRGPNNEDLSQGIAKVVFQLHPSFAIPVRELTAPPFEVTEKGWGEFEASIRIVWRDPAEKALVLMHLIKLYPPIVNVNVNAPSSGTGTGMSDGVSTASDKKEGQPVIHEFYDEVVFTDPTESFHNQLMSGSLSTGEIPKVKSNELAVQESFKSYSDLEDFNILLEAQKFLENELASVKDRILRADCNKNELDIALIDVSAKAKVIAAPPPVPASPASVKRKSSSKSSGGGSKKSKTSTQASVQTSSK